jgi:hypothetical protein
MALYLSPHETESPIDANAFSGPSPHTHGSAAIVPELRTSANANLKTLFTDRNTEQVLCRGLRPRQIYRFPTRDPSV